MVASEHCYVYTVRDCNAAGVEAKIGQTKHHESILLAHDSLELLQSVRSIQHERYLLAADDVQKLDTFLGLGNRTAAKRASNLGVPGNSTVALEWPPAFSPPVLFHIWNGPEGEREAYFRRIGLPWGSTVGREDDEVELKENTSRAMSMVPTEASTSSGAMADKASYALSQAASLQTMV